MARRTVKMISPAGRVVHEGVVQSASNYGTKEQPDWYIEFKCTRCSNPGAHYLKQQYDGYGDWKIEVTEHDD